MQIQKQLKTRIIINNEIPKNIPYRKSILSDIEDCCQGKVTIIYKNKPQIKIEPIIGKYHRVPNLWEVLSNKYNK